MDEPLTAAEYQKWTAIRAKGWFRYLLVYYIPVAGVGFALLTLLFRYLINGTLADWRVEAGEFAFKAVAFGGIMGWLQWRSWERGYALGAPKPESETTSDCLACGTQIPAGETRCPACGWTYESESKDTSGPANP